MLKTLRGSWSLVWIVVKHVLNQTNGVIRSVLDQFLQQLSSCLREFKPDSVSQFVPIWPVQFSWVAEHLANFEDLVLLTRPWEQGFHCVQLCHYCPKSKNVDWRSVLGIPQ